MKKNLFVEQQYFCTDKANLNSECKLFDKQNHHYLTKTIQQVIVFMRSLEENFQEHMLLSSRFIGIAALAFRLKI